MSAGMEQSSLPGRRGGGAAARQAQPVPRGGLLTTIFTQHLAWRSHFSPTLHRGVGTTIFTQHLFLRSHFSPGLHLGVGRGIFTQHLALMSHFMPGLHLGSGMRLQQGSGPSMV